MIIRSPDLDQAANIARLYDVFTQLWIKRGKFRAGMKEEGKHAFMQDLAMEMWLHDKQSIHYKDLEGRIQNYFGDLIRTREDLDYFDHDTRTCSFLNRDPQGNYGFIHKSFMEFFVAKKIAQALSTNTIDPSFRERVFSPEISSFVAQLAAADLDALATLCAWAFDEKSTLSWNALGIVSFLKSFDPEPAVKQLVQLSNKKERPRSGIIWVLGELGVTQYGVLELLHRALNDTRYGSRGAWWEAAFALEKVERIKDPVGALIEKLPPEWTFAKALEHFREVVEAEPESERVTSSDLPDGPPGLEAKRISVDQRAVVAIVREYRKGGSSNSRTRETVADLFSSLDLSCDIMDRRAYHAIWLLGELRVSSELAGLLRAVDHPQSPVRNMLAEAIGKIGLIPDDNRSIDVDRERLNALKRLLVDKYYRVRFHAAQAVRKIRAAALLTDLKQALDREPMPDIQNEMLKTVRVLEAHLADERAVTSLPAR
jgi:HEAT repeat protein